MKKLAAMMLVAAMGLSMMACGGYKADADSDMAYVKD